MKLNLRSFSALLLAHKEFMITGIIQDHLTRSVSPYAGRVGLWSQRSTGLQFGVGELREVGHHGLLVQLGVHHFLWFDKLERKEISHERNQD